MQGYCSACLWVIPYFLQETLGKPPYSGLAMLGRVRIPVDISGVRILSYISWYKRHLHVATSEWSNGDLTKLGIMVVMGKESKWDLGWDKTRRWILTWRKSMKSCHIEYLKLSWQSENINSSFLPIVYSSLTSSLPNVCVLCFHRSTVTPVTQIFPGQMILTPV